MQTSRSFLFALVGLLLASRALVVAEPVLFGDPAKPNSSRCGPRRSWLYLSSSLKGSSERPRFYSPRLMSAVIPQPISHALVRLSGQIF